MTANNHIVLTGHWPDKKTATDFFKAAGIDIHEGEAFQLFQTYSECCLETFNGNTPIDSKMLEQYRAFCPTWELWIRNINGEELKFRFIGQNAHDGIMEALKEAGFVTIEDKTDAVAGLLIEPASYPLWGKALAADPEKNVPKGWYTQQIPRILDYPVTFPESTGAERVYLKVEELLRRDGTVKLVRFTGLEIR